MSLGFMSLVFLILGFMSLVSMSLRFLSLGLSAWDLDLGSQSIPSGESSPAILYVVQGQLRLQSGYRTNPLAYQD